MAIKDVTRTVTAGRKSGVVLASGSGTSNGIVPLGVGVIQADPAIQMRAGGLDETRLQDYAERMIAGDDFPPVVVFESGGVFRLADGFHRVAAAEVAGLAELPARVLQGDRRAALLYAVGANADHGLDRTPEDKDRAVRAMLDDPEWGVWSDSEIARRCRVSQPFVGKVRGIVERERAAARGSAPAEDAPQVRKRIDKHGNVGTINVGGLGAKPYWEIDQIAGALAPALEDADVSAPRVYDAAAGRDRETLAACLRVLDAAGARVRQADVMRALYQIAARWGYTEPGAGDPDDLPAWAGGGSDGGGSAPARGKCAVCGRALTDPAAIAAGIGPCCAAKRAGGAGGDGGASERREAAERARAVLADADRFRDVLGAGVADRLINALRDAITMYEGVR